MLTIHVLCKRAAVWILATAALVATWSLPALADMYDCPVTMGGAPANGQSQNIVTIGEIDAGAGLPNQTTDGLQRLMIFILNSQLADLVTGAEPIRVEPCANNAPDLGDYAENVLRDRLAQGVVVEIWGYVDGMIGQFNFAILPLMPNQLGPFDVLGTTQFYRADRPFAGDLNTFLMNRGDVRALTQIAIGVRALTRAKTSGQPSDFTGAYVALCRATDFVDVATAAAAPGNFDWPRLRELTVALADVAKAGAGGVLGAPPAGVVIESCLRTAPVPL